MVDVARRADHDVAVVLDHRALVDGGDADDALAHPPGVDGLDVRFGLLAQEREHVHRLGEGVGVDAREASIVGDTDDVDGLAVAREHAVAELGGEAFESAVGEMEVLREPFFELDVATLLLARGERPFEDGLVGGHVRRWRGVRKKLRAVDRGGGRLHGDEYVTGRGSREPLLK